jgi:hypothetical protein
VAVRSEGGVVLPAPGSGISRRRALAGLLLVPAAVSGCATGRSGTPRPEDPLRALADAARADAALAAAAITADPALAERVQPLVDARTAHATALDAEVRRLRRGQPTSTPAPVPPVEGAVPLARVRAAARASADSAAEAALDLPVDRVGLVASVAACCAGYATVLT